MKGSKPRRVWQLEQSAWFTIPGYAFTSEERAVAAARRDWPNGRSGGVMNYVIGVGSIEDRHSVRPLSEYQ